MDTKIYLGKVDIGAIQNNAGVFYGETILRGWQTRSKSNSSIGRVNGDANIISSRLNLLHDPDFIDMMVRTTKD